MTAEEILSLLAHPRFIILESCYGDWRIDYKLPTGKIHSLFDGTLDNLLSRFAEIVGEA